jgi:hypothetical protein
MAEARLPAPVAATVVDDLFPDGHQLALPGAMKFYDSGDLHPAGFNFFCPCGCGALGGVSVGPGGWSWNRLTYKPTVRPSILLHGHDGQPHWHGWLTDGVFTQA